MEVIKCETNDLLVPAQAEVVLEGTISANETAVEGPMGEYHGFIFPSKKAPAPVFTVNAITYRSNPIVPITVAGRAPDETHTVWAMSICAEILTCCSKKASRSPRPGAHTSPRPSGTWSRSIGRGWLR